MHREFSACLSLCKPQHTWGSLLKSQANPDDAPFLLFLRILWESIVSSGVLAHTPYWIQFILSDLYFSVIVLYLWSTDCKQPNQPSGFWLLAFHLLFNVIVKTSCARKEKKVLIESFSHWKKNLCAIKIAPNSNGLWSKWQYHCVCVFV